MPVPTVDAERRRETTRRGRKRGKSRWRARLLRRLLFALMIVALVPLGLTAVYRLPFVHPISTLMLADAVTLRGYDRQWVSLDEAGTNIVHAVMMSEDGQFCAHDGVDWAAVSTVLDDAFSGERPRGASTIPMQTVKNLFLWSGRSFLRKAIETPLAIYFDAVMPKRRIMEIYLNIVEWGPGIYGAEAAAQHYFGRSAKNLSARQAALLAVTLPQPILRNPAKPAPGLNRLANVIQQRASKAGAYVTCLR